jgi:hypothetical protein
MLDPCVRPRVHQGLVPVLVANEVWRTAVLAAGLDNNRRVLMHPDHFALEVQPVTYRCSHRSSILWSSTTECGRESGWPEDPRRHVGRAWSRSTEATSVRPARKAVCVGLMAVCLHQHSLYLGCRLELVLLDHGTTQIDVGE